MKFFIHLEKILFTMNCKKSIQTQLLYGEYIHLFGIYGTQI